MKNIQVRNRRATVFAAIYIFLASPPPARAFHEGHGPEGPIDRTFKVNKTGEVNIGRDVKIGNHFVRRGKYILTHEAGDARHVFVLSEVNKKKSAAELARIEFDSRFLPGSKRVKTSAILAHEQRDRSYEVLNIEIAGENGEHLFTRSTEGNNANASNKD
jgi:hypothetical protein